MKLVLYHVLTMPLFLYQVFVFLVLDDVVVSEKVLHAIVTIEIRKVADYSSFIFIDLILMAKKYCRCICFLKKRVACFVCLCVSAPSCESE